jgi:hypothetical protein
MLLDLRVYTRWLEGFPLWTAINELDRTAAFRRGAATHEDKRHSRKKRKGRKIKVGLSLAKAPRRKGDGLMSVMPSEFEGSKKISPCGRNDISSELGDFAPLREKYPNPMFLESRKIFGCLATLKLS